MHFRTYNYHRLSLYEFLCSCSYSHSYVCAVQMRRQQYHPLNGVHWDVCHFVRRTHTVLYPQCPGWTQTKNTLGLATNPDSSQLTVEAPIETRMTRSDKRRVPPNAKVDSVYIFKVGKFIISTCPFVFPCLLKLPWNSTMTVWACRAQMASRQSSAKLRWT